MLLSAFPVLRAWLLPYVLPIFFSNPPFSPEFNAAFRAQVIAMPREDLFQIAPTLSVFILKGLELQETRG
jgi:hypothetical protein